MRRSAAATQLVTSHSTSCRARKRARSLVALGLAATLPALVTAQDAPHLATVRADIQQTLQALANDGGKLTVAREHGFQLEREIAAVTARHTELAARIEHKSARVAALQSQLTDLGERQTRARSRVRASAQARYTLAHTPRLKLLLNQDDVRTLSRKLAYYDYIVRTYQRDQHQAQAQVEMLANTTAALKLETDSLRRLRHDTEQELQVLSELRREHAALTGAVRTRMNEGNARVEQLRNDEQQVLSLVEDLHALTPTASTASASFAALKGQLAWPASGRIANVPGSALRTRGALWPGVFIEAGSAAPVRAIAAGRVVFADWFRNLGQLVIVDHGDGYMSLYGNNADLLRKPGEEVVAGDTLAHVGGGANELPSGVYFELRAAGAPLDPRVWCVAR